MPKNKEAFTRYRLIDEALTNKQKPYPSLEELVEKCESILGKSFSNSTIQKDIYAMRFDEGLNFHAPIDYHKLHKGYFYTDPTYSISKLPLKQDDLYALEFAAGMLKQFRDFPILKQFETTIERLLQAVHISRSMYGVRTVDIIQVERASHTEGTDLLDGILRSILDHKTIQFDYFNFAKNKSSSHKLHPYLVREYRNRWYVTGFSEAFDKVLTFGLDRIRNIRYNDETFRQINGFDSKEFFRHSFGITVNDLKAQKIILSFSPLEGRYIKAQAIHHTQKIIKENKNEFRISINVIPSHELNMQILSYGENCKVIKPDWLREEIKKTLRNSLNNYS